MGRDVGGSRDSVIALDRSDLTNYHRQQYVANNMVVSVAGNVSHQQVMDEVQAHMGEWSANTPLEPYPVNQTVSGPQVALERRKTDQAHICLAFPGVSAADPRRYALALLSTVLGEGMTSRLFLPVRERQGLAYDVHSSALHYRDCGSVVIYCGTDPAKVDAALSAILTELERLRAGVTDDELRRAVEFSTGRLLLRMEDTRAVMSSLGAQELLVDRVRTPDEVVEEVRSVTSAQVREVAETFVTPDAYKLAVVGPFRSDARFRRLLAV